MLPPKSAFVTPVMSTEAPLAEAQPRRPGGGGGGPVIEYVRGPMRIAAAPVASANPNDAGTVRRRGRKQRRWERRDFSDGSRPGWQNGRPNNGNGGGGPGGPSPGNGPGGAPNAGFSGNGGNGQPWRGPEGEGGRRRRRRRRRRGNGNGVPGGFDANAQPGGGGGPPQNAAPVQFFVGPGEDRAEPPQLGPDGLPMRKRRRRRRRGRGGRNREWRAGGGGPDSGGGIPPTGGNGEGGGGES